jgi:hypothetical protein
MKNIILILVLLPSSMLYASFPVENSSTFYNDTVKNSNDTVKSESLVDYHTRLQNSGFDIEKCRCEDCQKFKGIKPQKEKSKTARTAISIGLMLLIIIVIIVGLFALMLTWSFFEWLN